MEIRTIESIKAPAEGFTGDAWVDQLARTDGLIPVSVIAVHFAPGARTRWHSHSHGQVLLVTEGEGRIQSRGGDVVALHQGDTAWTPGGEWHWHGAAPNRTMTHVSVAQGSSEMGEHVTDAEYSS